MRIDDTLQKFSTVNLIRILIYGLISLYLVISWLPNSSLLGGGDVGIPTYNVNVYLSYLTDAWWQFQNTGTVNPLTYTAVPIYIFFNFLSNFGLDGAVIQKVFFVLILFFGSMFVHKLARFFEYREAFAFISGLFYIFNLFSMSVWHRGVHNAMWMLLVLPVGLYILVTGLESRKYISLLYLGIWSIVATFGFGAPAYVVAYWLVLGLYIFVFAINNFNNKKDCFYVCRYLGLLLLGWILINYWWIDFFITSSRIVFASLTSIDFQQKSSDVLVALKEQTALEYVFRGISKSTLIDIKDFGDFYTRPFFSIISWFGILIIVSTSFYQVNSKKISWQYLFGLMLIILFISKGVNQPLGWLNKSLYDNLSILAPLRNPYEKIGIILPLIYSLLFGLGCQNLYCVLRQRTRTYYLFIVLILVTLVCLFIVVWPMWLGKVFYYQEKTGYIQVPSYYQNASDWIVGQGLSGRILHLPASPGESVTYNWGYSGVDPMQLLMPPQSLANQTGLGASDLLLQNLIWLFRNNRISDIHKSLVALNVEWIVLHNEVDWKIRGHDSTERLEQVLSGSNLFTKVNQVGPLGIWKVNTSKDGYGAYNAKNIIYINHINNETLKYVWGLLGSENDVFVNDYELINLSSKTVLFPDDVIEYSGLPKIDEKNVLNYFPAVRVLPGEWYYFLIGLKEWLTGFLSTQNQISSCVDLSSKRIMEAYLLRNHKNSELEKSLIRYKEELSGCRDIKGVSFNEYIQSSVERQEISEKLTRQLYVLKNLLQAGEISPELNNTIDFLNKFLTQTGIAPYFTKDVTGTSSRIYRFNVPHDGVYNFKYSNISDRVAEDPVDIDFINRDNLKLAPKSVESSELTYPEYYLVKGEHEFRVINKLYELNFRNLILGEGVDRVTMDGNVNEGVNYKFFSQKSPANMHLEIGEFNINSTYQISFEYFVNYGRPPIVKIIQDSDPFDGKGQIIPTRKIDLDNSEYEFGWKNFTFEYKPSLNSSQAKLVLSVVPWNNCKEFLSSTKCSDEDVSQHFDKDSLVMVRNLKLSEKFNELPYLIRTGRQEQSYGRMEGIERVDSSNLLIKEYESSKSGLIVFPETFHPLWDISPVLKSKHLVVNGYANGWLVECTDNRAMHISFGLDKYVKKGLIISSFSVLGLVLIIMYLDWYKKDNDK